jgi:hypothetical protein
MSGGLRRTAQRLLEGAREVLPGWLTFRERLLRSDARLAAAEGRLRERCDAAQALPDAPPPCGDGPDALRLWLRWAINRDPEFWAALDRFDLELSRVLTAQGHPTDRHAWLAYVTGLDPGQLGRMAQGVGP